MRRKTETGINSFTAALIGNPNSGKTTLFNALTGTEQYVGNWPGVTVEKKEGTSYVLKKRVRIIDLPGIYSMSSCSAEERTALEYILSGEADVIINIVDAAHLERSLFLTLQLLESGLPVVMALTFLDEVKKQKAAIDIDRLSEKLNIPVVAVSAAKRIGIEELMTKAEYTSKRDGFVKTLNSKISSQERYKRIEIIIKSVYTEGRGTGRFLLDKILAGKWTALPVFLLMMLAVFAITFGSIGTYLTESTSFAMEEIISPLIKNQLESFSAPKWLIDLVINGALKGVGGVLSFVPQTAMLFFFLSILEDSGYMARAAFITDSLMARIGLSGKSVIPMLLGLGCSVPAILNSKTVADEKQRKMTVMLIPFMSCSAKLPVYGAIASAFFGRKAFIVVLSLYACGILSGILTAKLLNIKSGGESSVFAMELPPYRMPTMKNALLHTGERVESFVKKAGTTILLASVVIWALGAYAPDFSPASGENSILGKMGSIIAPLLAPLGFGTWQAAVALISGLMAKETIISSLSVLYGLSSISKFGLAAADMGFMPLSACSFLTFVLLYPPCAAAQAAMKKEIGVKNTAFSVLWQLGFAYIASFTVYMLGRLIGLA